MRKDFLFMKEPFVTLHFVQSPILFFSSRKKETRGGLVENRKMKRELIKKVDDF